MNQQDQGPTTPDFSAVDSTQPVEKSYWDLPATPTPQKPVRVGDPEGPIEDFWQNTTGLVGGVTDVIKGYHDLLNPFVPNTSRDQWVNGWNLLMQGKIAREVPNYVWKGAKEEFANHWTNAEGEFDLGYTLKHHPASALMDLALIRDMAGGGAKMFGKLAGGESRALMTADEVSKLGPMGKADRLVQLGERAQKIPLDPYSAIAAGVSKTGIGQWFNDEFGFGKETKALERIRAGTSSEVDLEHMNKARLLMDAKFGEGSGERFFNALGRGHANDFAALTEGEHDLMQRYWATQGLPSSIPDEWTKGWAAREKWYKDRGLIPEDTQRVLGIQAALRDYGPDGLKSSVHGRAEVERRIQEAMGKISTGEYTPTYYHLQHPKDHEYTLIENFLRDVKGEGGGGGQGGTSFLNQRTGSGDYINDKDPLGALLKQMGMEAQFDKKVKFFDRAMYHLGNVGEAEVVPADAIPAGKDIVPHEIWRKYMLAEKRAGGLAYGERVKGVDVMQAERNAYAQLVADPKVLEDVKVGNKVVVVPKYVANYLKYQLAIPSTLGRMYDKYASLWKGMATVMRPTYWINVAAGNGFLSALHGVSPMDAARYFRNRKFLPPELQAIVQGGAAPAGASRFQQALLTLRKWDSQMHTHLTKGPGFAHEVEAIRREVQATAQKLNDAGHKFFIGADTLEDPDKFYRMVAQSPEQLNRAIDEHVMLREQLAGQAPKIISKQAEYDANFKQLQAMDAELSKMQGKGGRPAMLRDLDPVTHQKWIDLRNADTSLREELAGMKEDYLRHAEREGVVRKSMPGLDRIAEWAEKGIEPINDLEGAYLRLHPLERRWLSRAIPFYPWTKAMTKLVFRLPFTYPKQTFMWNRFSAMMQDLTSHDEHMPEYLQGALHVGVTGDGAHVFVRPFWNPFMGEKPGTLGGVTMPSIAADIAKQHPLMKVAHDLVGGVDSFTQRPWSPNEKMVRTDTGEVFQFDPKTKTFNRTIAQPSMWRRLWGLFPQSQMIDNFLPDSLGPERKLDANGKEMYPVSWGKRLAKTILPVSFQTNEQQARSTSMNAKLFQQYVRQVAHMAPEDREAALKVIKDAFSPNRR